MTPEGLEGLPEFRRGVDTLVDEDTPIDTVVSLSRDADGWVASMALAALAERDDVPEDWVAWAARNPARPSNCEDALLLRALARHATAPVIGSALTAIGAVRDEHVAEFVRARSERGEPVDASTFRSLTLDDADKIEAFIERFEPELGVEFREGFYEWRALRRLTDIGRIWEPPFDRPPALLAGRRRELVELVVSALEATPPRSVLLVGEHGVGKTTLARVALDRMERQPTVFETTAAQINAGAIYIGELEGRVKSLVDALEGQDVVWLLPELQETLFAGQHARSPQGLLDALLPARRVRRDHARRGGDADGRRAARRGAAAGLERLRGRACTSARRGGRDRGRTTRARAGRARRRNGRRDARGGVRARAALPARRGPAGERPAPAARHRGRGGRARRRDLRRRRRAGDARSGVRATARPPRPRRSAPARRGALVLRAARPRAAARRWTASSSGSR